MATPKKPSPASTDAPPAARVEPETGTTSTAPEGPPEPVLTLSSALGTGSEYAGPNPILGALPPLGTPPAIPADLDAELNPTERRIVWAMVNGQTYADARRALYGPHAPAAPADIPPAIAAAVAHVIRDIAGAAGLSRAWIVAQTVALYERACAAVPVLDRKGRPTGAYRFDGATAHNCLKALAEWEGSLYPSKRAGVQPGDVVELLRLVADRGRPGLDQRRAPRLLDLTAAAQHEPKA